MGESNIIINKDQVKSIIDIQKQYFFTNETKDITFRLKQLSKLKDSIKKNEKAILEALYKDLRKSEFEAYSTEVGYSLDSIGYVMRHLKSWSKVKRAKTPIHQFGAKSYVYPEPYGVVLIIGPFNYPFQLLIEPLIGAIAAGNCAVLKPSESTPNVIRIVKKIIIETFDEKYITVVEGEKETTSALINSPFDYIFFTGSVPVGKIVMEAASKNLTPITLELGGKSPTIVDKTANLEVAAKRIAWGKFMNAGQTCVAPDYLLVHKAVKEDFIKKLTSTIKQFFGENPSKSPDFCRIVNERQLDRLINVLEKDKDKIIFGGDYDKEDLYISPTIINDANWQDSSMADEIFGPILPILEYEHIDEAIAIINKRPKPLALYVFTEDKNIEELVLKSTSFGGGCVNDTISHVASPYIPFGGVGNSGLGSYHGKASFDVFSHKKSIMKKTTAFSINIIFPPYGDKIKLVRKLLK